MLWRESANNAAVGNPLLDIMSIPICAMSTIQVLWRSDTADRLEIRKPITKKGQRACIPGMIRKQ